MEALAKHPAMIFVQRNRALLFPAAAAALIFVILIPLPTFLLDYLLVFNIVTTTIVMLTVMYLRSPLEFSSFPSLLLALTLLRLVLNTATTRLILSNVDGGTEAAGEVVQAFGTFVAGNSLAVGVIIFTIITVIQFVVITKGATRVAEVAARFTLDGMPGKQMAIDADLNAGAIDEKEARRRREAIAAEADFYGAMDGASKFVRGDAIAGIIITFVNILGGLYVGTFEGSLSIVESLEVYTKLSIGDGLSSQVPAFIVSIAAAMLVTRSAGKTNMGEDVIAQVFGKPIALVVAAAFLMVLTVTPLPKFPLITLALGCGMVAYFTNQQQVLAVTQKAAQTRATERAKTPPIESQLSVDALELQVGFGLVPLVDKSRGGDMLDRIGGVRNQMASELGLIVPPVRIRDNSDHKPNEYAVLLRGQEIAAGALHVDRLLAIDSGLGTGKISGINTTEPAFGLPASWIDPGQREKAEQNHYTVVEPAGVLATHLTEIIKANAAELLTRAGVHKLLDHLKQQNAALHDDVIPGLLKVGEVQKVLQGLLRERVPIRDLEAILEVLGDWAPRTKDPEILTEYVRNGLSRTICGMYKGDDDALHCVTIDARTEDFVHASIHRTEVSTSLGLPPARQSEFAAKVREQIDNAAATTSGTIVVLAAPQIRVWVRRLIEPVLPQTPVLGMNEVARGVEIRAHGVVSLNV
ncbi:MAG: flagellar biosynthesis protein FlhA [Phycisphaerae bacterium]